MDEESIDAAGRQICSSWDDDNDDDTTQTSESVPHKSN